MTQATRSATRTLARELEDALRAQGNAERARGAKAYLKSALTFLGVPVPAVRSAARAFAARHPELDHDALWALTEVLWASRVHELRSVAIALLERRRTDLALEDMAPLAALIRDADTWAHVDWLATKLAGHIVATEPKAARVLDVWATDPSFWLRRGALLALHDAILRGGGDFAHFARLAVPMLGEREFFIRKAIGWLLRSAARKRPALTEEFVAHHARTLSALSFREATRNLPAETALGLRALREGP